jgi:hypothetical protein
MRVPTLQPARILAAPRPQVRAQAPDADAFGAGLGQGIEQANRTAFGVWRQEMQRVNEARVLEADNQAAAAERDATTALEQAQGKDAPQAFEDTTAALQKRQQEIERKLANPVQREAFRRAATNRLQSFENRGAAHVVRETRRADTQAMEAAVGLAYDQAKANRDDTLALGNGFVELRAKWGAWADRQGLPAEERKRQEQALQDGYIGSVVTAHVTAENDLAAAKILSNYGGHLSATAKEQLGKLVQTSSTKGQAMRLADTAHTQGLDATAGRAWLIEQAGDNPELRDMAIQRWEGHRAAAQRATSENQVDAYAKAFAILEDPAKDYASIPAELLQRLEQRPDLKSQLMGFGRKQDRVVVENEPELIVELERLAVDNPARFAQVDVKLLRGRLTPAKIDEYAKAIGQAKAGGKGGKEYRGIITREQAIKDSYLAAGIDEKDDPEDAAFFRQMLHERVLAMEQTTGKEATADQVTLEARKLQVRVALDPRNGKRPDTVEWQRARTLLGNLSEDDRTALMAEAGTIERAVRMLMERQRVQQKRAQTPEAKAEDKARVSRAVSAGGGISFNPADW